MKTIHDDNEDSTRVQISAFKCLRCQHIWAPRKFKNDKDPVCCPKCHSPYWNIPKE